MIEISFLLALHFITFLYGIGLMRCLVRKEDIQKDWPIVFSLGYALLAVLVTLAYSWGANISWIAYGIIAGGLVFGVFGIPHLKFISEKVGSSFVGYVLIAILLLLPKFTGGDQFSLFQGNIYDHFNYLTSSLVYSLYDHSTIQSASIAEFLVDPLMIVPQSSLETRPAVMLLFSALGSLFGGKYLELAYVYNIFFLLQVVLLIAWSSRLLGVNFKTGLLIGLIFCGGFWGQMIFDMNAWSHLAALPLLVLFVSLSLKQLSNPEENTLTPFALISISVAGGLYLYPEATIFLGFGIGILTLIQIRSRYSVFQKLALAGLIAVGVAILDYQSTLLFLMNQILFSLGETPDWYQYYFSFLFGNDGIPEALKTSIQNRDFDLGFLIGLLRELLDAIPGIMGLFFLTPSMDMQSWNAWILVLLVNGFIIGLWIFFVKELLGWLRRKCDTGIILPSQWLGYIIIQLGVIGILVITNNIWVATKGWLYLIPFLMLLFLVPFFSGKKQNTTGKILLMIFIISQLTFAGIRPFAASVEGGIHYRFKPYPGSLPQAEKDHYSWSIETVTKVTQDCELVLIPQISNPFYEHFLLLVLRQNQIAFQKTASVNLYYGESEDIGKMGTKTPDCLLQLDSEQGRIGVKISQNF